MFRFDRGRTQRRSTIFDTNFGKQAFNCLHDLWDTASAAAPSADRVDKLAKSEAKLQ